MKTFNIYITSLVKYRNGWFSASTSNDGDWNLLPVVPLPPIAGTSQKRKHIQGIHNAFMVDGYHTWYFAKSYQKPTIKLSERQMSDTAKATSQFLKKKFKELIKLKRIRMLQQGKRDTLSCTTAF